MRILLITYYFPPAGGAAVQRWLRFIRCLVARGIEVGVVCAQGGDYPFRDESLQSKIPAGLRIIRAKAPSMERLWHHFTGKDTQLPHGDIQARKMGLMARLLVLLRLNLIIPDLRVFWNPYAFKAVLSELRSHPYDVIISTGPPHSSHLIGLKLKRQTGIKWFTDFRDPWLDIHYLKLNPPSALTRWIHSQLERKVLRSSDGNFIISEAIAAALPDAPKTVLYNGFDPEDFRNLRHHPADKFRIKYVGQLTAGQDIMLIVKLTELLSSDFELSLIGTKLSNAEQNLLRQKLKDRFRHVEFVPHQDALQEMVDSELLLLLVNDYEGSKGMLTTKLFEYLAARTPILCIGPSDGAAAGILKDTDAGQCFGQNQMQAASAWVSQLPKALRTKGNIDLYSVDQQIDTLIGQLNAQVCC